MQSSARRTFLLSSVSGAPGVGALGAFGVFGALGTLGAPALSWAGPRPLPRAESPLVGVDPALVEAGLTARWQAAMRQDLGWSARWSSMDTMAVLDQLEGGQIDAGLFLSHPRADALDKQGLIYNRHTIARTDVLLLGPTEDLAGIRSETDASRALSQVLAAAGAGAARWQAADAHSPLGELASGLTKGLSAAPVAAGALGKAALKAPSAPAYRLMTRAQWLKHPPRGERLKVWLAGGPALVLNAEVACSFRARHAGAKLLVSWLQWPLAQGAIKATRPAWRGVKD
jgi:tungstate transport system substrate-binding protein